MFLRLSFVLLLTFVCCSPLLAQQPKKLIEFGGDAPDTSLLAARIRDMENTPFDGCVFQLTSDSPRGRERRADFSWEGWGSRAFTKREMQQVVNDLKSTEFKNFTDCFAQFNSAPGDVDWFSPDFSIVVNNARLASWIAKEGGVKGVFFDTEYYQSRLWEYHKQVHAKTKSYQEYAAQLRKRGTEVMQAFQSEYPEITIILSYGYSGPWVDAHPWPFVPGQDAFPEKSNDPRKLKFVPYGLQAPFMDGMIDAAGPKVRLIDGSEFTYTHARQQEFLKARQMFRQEVLPLMAEDVRTKYPRVFSQALALWIDVNWRQPGGWNFTDFTNNHWQPEEFQLALTNALKHTDEYVWLYSEHVSWFPPSRNVPAAYVEAVRNARSAAGLRDLKWEEKQVPTPTK